jgi:hypothetical protein
MHNTRVSFPNVPILLSTADIKACFCYACIHTDLIGAFGFASGGYYNLATAMVFCSKISASSWEPYRRAIELMSKAFANRPDLVIKHRCYLDMIRWAEINPNVKITPAAACTILGGLPTKVIEEIRLKARIFVDNSLVLALYRAHMEMVLAALIEAIFVVMGKPDTALRQLPLAMDKWLELVVGPILIMLGLIIDTNKLTVAIPKK